MKLHRWTCLVGLLLVLATGCGNGSTADFFLDDLDATVAQQDAAPSDAQSDGASTESDANIDGGPSLPDASIDGALLDGGLLDGAALDAALDATIDATVDAALDATLDATVDGTIADGTVARDAAPDALLPDLGADAPFVSGPDAGTPDAGRIIRDIHINVRITHIAPSPTRAEAWLPGNVVPTSSLERNSASAYNYVNVATRSYGPVIFRDESTSDELARSADIEFVDGAGYDIVLHGDDPQVEVIPVQWDALSSGYAFVFFNLTEGAHLLEKDVRVYTSVSGYEAFGGAVAYDGSYESALYGTFTSSTAPVYLQLFDGSTGLYSFGMSAFVLPANDLTYFYLIYDSNAMNYVLFAHNHAHIWFWRITADELG